MLDLNAFALFAAVAHAGSFSEAARRLGVPVSTVSRRVAGLEEDLGVRLLERSTRRLRLTDIGAEILGRADQGLEAFKAIEMVVTNQMDEVKGTLRLSAPPSIGASFLAPLLTSFRASYPGVRFETLVTERRVDLISEGIDVALRVGPLVDSSLIARRLVTYQVRLVASPSYLEQHGVPTHPSELEHHALVSFASWSAKPKWSLVREGETIVIEPEPWLAVNDYQSVMAALVAGAGIGELPDLVAPQALSIGDLVQVLPDWSTAEHTLFAVQLSNRQASRLVRLFNEFAVRHARAGGIETPHASPS